ncbi:MAG TPA: hypothetical protein VGF38_24230 [Ktedonobacterales bacterium]|jgi:hypothetical protein
MERIVSDLLGFLQAWGLPCLVLVVFMTIMYLILSPIINKAEDNTSYRMPSSVENLPDDGPFIWIKGFFLILFFVAAAIGEIFTLQVAWAILTALVALGIAVGLAQDIQDHPEYYGIATVILLSLFASYVMARRQARRLRPPKPRR